MGKRERLSIALAGLVVLVVAIGVHTAQTRAEFTDTAHASGNGFFGATLGTVGSASCWPSTVMGESALRLMWLPPTESAIPFDSYVVEILTGDPQQLVAERSTPFADLTLTIAELDTVLSPEQSYVFQVRAKNSASGWLSVVPSEPASFAHTSVSGWSCTP